MAGHFAVDRLSREGRLLITRLYREERTYEEIRAALRNTTGEMVGASSLNRWCVRKLKKDPRAVSIQNYMDLVIQLVRSHSTISEAEMDFTAALLAVLGAQTQTINHRLGEQLEIFKETLREEFDELKTSLKNPQSSF